MLWQVSNFQEPSILYFEGDWPFKGSSWPWSELAPSTMGVAVNPRITFDQEKEKASYVHNFELSTALSWRNHFLLCVCIQGA